MIVLKVQSRIGRAVGEVPSSTEVQRASFVSYTGGEVRAAVHVCGT